MAKRVLPILAFDNDVLFVIEWSPVVIFVTDIQDSALINNDGLSVLILWICPSQTTDGGGKRQGKGSQQQPKKFETTGRLFGWRSGIVFCSIPTYLLVCNERLYNKGFYSFVSALPFYITIMSCSRTFTSTLWRRVATRTPASTCRRATAFQPFSKNHHLLSRFFASYPPHEVVGLPTTS